MLLTSIACLDVSKVNIINSDCNKLHATYDTTQNGDTETFFSQKDTNQVKPRINNRSQQRKQTCVTCPS